MPRPFPRFISEDGHCIVPLRSVCDLLKITIEPEPLADDDEPGEKRPRLIMRLQPSDRIVARSEPGECPWTWLRRNNLLKIAEARWCTHTGQKDRAKLRRPLDDH